METGLIGWRERWRGIFQVPIGDNKANIAEPFRLIRSSVPRHQRSIAAGIVKGTKFFYLSPSLSLSLPFFLFKFYPFFLFPFRFRLFFPIYFHLNGLEDSVNSGCLKFTSIKGLSVLKRPNLDDVIVARAQK